MTYAEAQHAVAELLGVDPSLGPERLSNARADFDRLHPRFLAELRALVATHGESAGRNRELRGAILQLVSIECAAGAGVERCRRWFHLLAALAAWSDPGTGQPIDLADAAIWSALAGDFDPAMFANWPDSPPTEATSERVVFRLLTRRPIPLTSGRNLFDNRHWEDLCAAVENRQAETASRAFRAIAAWWLEEFEDPDAPAYDPENFPTFEPAPNAALALAQLRDHLAIRLRRPAHERFYFVGRMMSQEPSTA